MGNETEKELRSLRAVVEQLVERLGARERRMYSQAEAAERLGVSPRHLSRLITAGKVRTSESLGGRPRVPADEIERLCLPPLVSTAPKKPRPPQGKTGRAAGDAVRAALRKKRS